MSQNGDSLSEKIIKQVEYYFGDVNLSKDKFLQEETQKDSGCNLNNLFFQTHTHTTFSHLIF